jgi:hypothetical protein
LVDHDSQLHWCKLFFGFSQVGLLVNSSLPFSWYNCRGCWRPHFGLIEVQPAGKCVSLVDGIVIIWLILWMTHMCICFKALFSFYHWVMRARLWPPSLLNFCVCLLPGPVHPVALPVSRWIDLSIDLLSLLSGFCSDLLRARIIP